MKIVCISDTHGSHTDIEIPAGDVLIHAGDATCEGALKEVAGFCNWFASQPHKHKILIAGNHDWLFERDPGLARSLTKGFHYLEDSEVNVGGLSVWGSPWSPEFNGWAFNLPRGPRLAQKWDLIPVNIDILVTHGPPRGILDLTPTGEMVGCADLTRRLMAANPLLHVFGHVHSGYGELLEAGTQFVNASICDESYAPTNKPVVVEL